MIGRRKELEYIRNEIYFFWTCNREDLISNYHFIRALVIRIPLRLLGPILKPVYTKLLRA